MPQNQEPAIKPKLEIQPSDPELWDTEDQNSLLGFFKLLIEIDIRNNPENYKSNFKFNIYIPMSKNDFFNIISIFIAILGLLIAFGGFILQIVEVLG